MKNTKFYYTLLAVSFVALMVGTSFATEKTPGQEEADKNPSTKQTGTTPEEKPISQEKPEPYGLESGKLVDGPANLADKIGNKINAFLGNEDSGKK